MEDDFSSIELNEDGKPYNIRHRCFYFSKDIIEFIKQVRIEKLYFSIYDQLVRSATSIGANVVEAKAGSTKRDWKNFYLIALKSANETKYWLCLIRDTMECDKKRIKELIKEADEISNILATIIISANK